MTSRFRHCAAALLLVCGFSTPATATVINEILTAPTTPGNAWSGVFEVMPTSTLWAFGVGTSRAQDVSVSGNIEGQRASRHWVPRLISRASWDDGVDWEAARPILSNPPSDFSLVTSSGNWQWDSATDVAFYLLYEQGSPIATLKAGQTYDNFRFFTDGPESTFATYAQDGTVLDTGETQVTIIGGPMPVPEPSTLVLFAGVLLMGSRLARRS